MVDKRLILIVALALTAVVLVSAQDFSTGESSGVLTVYRSGAPLESLPSVTTVTINQDLVFELYKDEYMSITLDPGEYLLYFVMNLVGANTAAQEAYLVEVVAGDEVFVNVVIESPLTRNVERIHTHEPDLSEFSKITEVFRIQEPN
jgi:hypothetical protein